MAQETLHNFSQEYVATLRAHIGNAKGYIIEEGDLNRLLYMSEQRKLDPLLDQIHVIFRKDRDTGISKPTFQTSIDAIRLQAARTGQYAGSDDVIFSGDLDNRKATTTVWRIVQGIRCPFTATAYYEEYVQLYHGRPTAMWAEKPHVLLGKCVEALALRKGFPEETSGLYTPEEMMQADNDTRIPEVRMLQVESPKLRLEAKAEPIKPKSDVSQAQNIDVWHDAMFKGGELGDSAKKKPHRIVLEIAEKEYEFTCFSRPDILKEHADWSELLNLPCRFKSSKSTRDGITYRNLLDLDFTLPLTAEALA